MREEEVKSILRRATDQIMQEQPELLGLDVTERALSHHLARYIAKLIPGYDVDVEYNRHGLDPKCLNLPPRNKLNGKAKPTIVLPDIVVHKRNTDTNNILVVEMKKSRRDIEFDELKLKAFRRQLSYQYAAHVILTRGKVPEIIWVD